MSAWGSIEERYRLLCMKILIARYAYYVMATPIMEDLQYDALEKGLEKFEAKMPHLAHPKSPTKIPGSDKAQDYPQSVRFHCENNLAGGRGITRLQCVFEKDGPLALDPSAWAEWAENAGAVPVEF